MNDWSFYEKNTLYLGSPYNRLRLRLLIDNYIYEMIFLLEYTISFLTGYHIFKFLKLTILIP